MILRPYQKDASQFLQNHVRAFVHAPAGSGKTVIGAHALSRVAHGNCYWLANTQEQVDQAVRALGSFEPTHDVDLTVCCVAAQPDTSNADFIVIDECFPEGTLVDGVPIEQLRVGGIVTGVDGANTVTRVFRKVATSLLRVRLSDRSLVCTPEHPLLLSTGEWREAKDLRPGDSVVTLSDGLHHMRKGDSRQSKNLFVGVSLGVESEDDPKYVREARGIHHPLQKNKRDARPKNEGLGVHEATGHGVETAQERREWNTPSGCTTTVGLRAGVADRSASENKQKTSRIPSLLQVGCGEPGPVGGGRGGRLLARRDRKTKTRLQERSPTGLARVDSVEVLERTSDGTFGGLCPGGVVYNIETRPSHTYTANGVVVHNCHHTPARTWKALADKAPPTARLWGLSATPWSSDPERNELIRNTFQNFHEVNRAELLAVGALEEGKALMWDLDEEGCFDEQVEANTQAEWLKAKGRFHYLKGDMFKAKEQEQLRYIRWRHTQDALRLHTDRNDFACMKAAEEIANGQSVLMLVHAIEHGEQLAAAVPGSELVFSRIGARKRRERIAAFKAGELKCLIATSLADEGLDVPIASRLILVAGGRSAGKVEQRAGRVLRPYAGKTGGIIHDFLDRGATLANAQAWARMRTYEALGYQPEVRTV